MTARQDIARHREEWIRRDHPRCRPRREAGRPSSRTSARQAPTSPRLPHSRAPVGSEKQDRNVFLLRLLGFKKQSA